MVNPRCAHYRRCGRRAPRPSWGRVRSALRGTDERRSRAGPAAGTHRNNHPTGRENMAEGINLEGLRQDIHEAGALWEPGETSMTELSAEDQAKRLGFTPPPGEPTLEEMHTALESGAIS